MPISRLGIRPDRRAAERAGRSEFLRSRYRGLSLTPIHVDTWNGFVFVNFSTEPEQSLSEYLAPIAAKLNEHSFADRPSCVVLTAEIDVNWKAMLDNFQETYHLSFIHRFSVGDRAVAPANPFGTRSTFSSSDRTIS